MKQSNERMTMMNSLLGTNQNQEVKISGDTDIKTPSHQEVSTSREQEIKRARRQETKRTRNQESKSSSPKNVKTSAGKDTKRSRVVDSDGIKRRPINITIREDYYRTIRLLAIDRNVQSWRLIDEALGQYLDNKVNKKNNSKN